ncbi:Hypothetical predicted protein [Cloeon dipterum]|uniref:Uncharacterized protein n=1 Tax=Cloeon dipterum TaxID=197152 RepID=A0A8S1DPG2_9INSE|nr:Hypothetical predicted protein [Cloeon dipterum]
MIHVRLRVFSIDAEPQLLSRETRGRRKARGRQPDRRRANSEGMSSEAVLLTCPSCRVTSRVCLSSQSCCPYCGHEYETDGAISFWRNSSEQMNTLHLPRIEQTRPSRLGNLTISRLGGAVQVTRIGALFLRPPSPTLPPIGQDPMTAWTPRDQNPISPRSYSVHQPSDSPESPVNYFGKSEDLTSFSRDQFFSEDQKLKYLESFRFMNSAFPFFIEREHHYMDTLKMKEGHGKYWRNAIHFLLSNKAHGFPLWNEFEEQMRSEDASFSCKPHVSAETTNTTFQHYFDDPLNHIQNSFDILMNDSVLVQLPFQPVMLFQWLTSSYFEFLEFELIMSPFYNLPIPKKFKPELACLHELLKTTQRNIGFLFDYLQCQITNKSEIFVGNLKVFDMILKKVMVFHKFWIEEFGIKHIEQLKIKCWQNWKCDKNRFRLKKGNMPLRKRNFLFNPDFWRGPHKDLKLFGNSNEQLFRQQDLTNEGSGEQLSVKEIEKILYDLFGTEALKNVNFAVLKHKGGFLKSLHKVMRAKELMELRDRINEKDQGVIGDAFIRIARIEFNDAFFEVARWIVYVFKTPPERFIIFNECLRDNLTLERVVSTIDNCEKTAFSLQDRLKFMWNTLDYKIFSQTISDSCALQYRLESIVLSCIDTHLQIENFENHKDDVLRDWQVVQYLLPCFVASYLNICECDPPVDESFKKCSEDQKLKYLESFRFVNSAFPFFIKKEHHDMASSKIKEGQGEYWGHAIHFLLSNKAHGFPLWNEFEEQMRSEDAYFSCKPHVSAETTNTTFQHYIKDPLKHFTNSLDILMNDSVLVQLPFQPVMLFQWLTSSYFGLLEFERNMPLRKRNFLFNPDFWRGPHKDLKLFGNSNEQLFRKQDLTNEGSGEQLSVKEIEKILYDLFGTEALKNVDVAVLKQKGGFLKSLHKARRAKELMELRFRINEKDLGLFITE